MNNEKYHGAIHCGVSAAIIGPNAIDIKNQIFINDQQQYVGENKSVDFWPLAE
jgi:hypothetical protein